MARDTREKILKALQEILVREGAHAVTLEAVAEDAGISKGGLLYHFPNKDALYQGLVERLAEQSQSEIDALPEGIKKSRWYLETSIPRKGEEQLSQSVHAVLRSADGNNPEIRERVRNLYQTWSNLVYDEVENQVLADAISLIGDGVYFNYLLGLKLPDNKRLQRLYDWLLKEAETPAPSEKPSSADHTPEND